MWRPIALLVMLLGVVSAAGACENQIPIAALRQNPYPAAPTDFRVVLQGHPSSILYSREIDGEKTIIAALRFDETGNVTYYESDTNEKHSEIYTYSDAKSRLSGIVYDVGGRKISSTRFTYLQSDGTLSIDQKEIDSNAVVSREVQSFGASGSSVKSEVYVPGSGTSTQVFVFDKNGRIVECDYIDDKLGGTYKTDRITYDTSGRILSRATESANGQLLWEFRYKYDMNGYPTRVVDKEQSYQRVYDYAYTYDKMGNWVARVITVEGASGDMKIRESRDIRYFGQ